MWCGSISSLSIDDGAEAVTSIFERQEEEDIAEIGLGNLEGARMARLWPQCRPH